MYTSPEEAASILRLMMEGMSVRSIERLTGLHRDTILRVLVHAGEHCETFLQTKVHAVQVNDVQCDEMWGLCRLQREKQRRGLYASRRCVLLCRHREAEQTHPLLAFRQAHSRGYRDIYGKTE
jgi:hypothetical protein